MTTIIQKTIYLDPKYLDNNIMEHLLSTLKNNMIGSCNKEFGHILSINKIIKILYTEDTFFNLEFESETLKPNIGDIFDGEVKMISKNGIFAEIKNIQKVLIPISCLQDYNFNIEEKSFVNGDFSIKEKNNIKICIKNVQYSKNNFNCIGYLI